MRLSNDFLLPYTHISERTLEKFFFPMLLLQHNSRPYSINYEWWRPFQTNFTNNTCSVNHLRTTASGFSISLLADLLLSEVVICRCSIITSVIMLRHSLVPNMVSLDHATRWLFTESYWELNLNGYFILFIFHNFLLPAGNRILSTSQFVTPLMKSYPEIIMD